MRLILEIIILIMIIMFGVRLLIYCAAYDGWKKIKDAVATIGEITWDLITWPWQRIKREKAEKEYLELVESLKADIILELMNATREDILNADAADHIPDSNE